MVGVTGSIPVVPTITKIGRSGSPGLPILSLGPVRMDPRFDDEWRSAKGLSGFAGQNVHRTPKLGKYPLESRSMVEYALLLTALVLVWWLITAAYHVVSNKLHQRKAERLAPQARPETEPQHEAQQST